MKETLWELASDLRAIDERIEAHEGEISDQDERDLDAIQGDFQTKVVSCGYYRRTLEHREMILKGEIESLQKRLSSARARREWISAYMVSQMRYAKRYEVESPDGARRWAIRETPGETVIEDVGLLPDQFVEIQRKAKVREVRKAFDSGMPIPGVSIKREWRLYDR